MINIQKIDHVGIRVHEEKRSVSFYEEFGFVVEGNGNFLRGQPIIMRHPAGIVLNVLGPANQPQAKNILQDYDEKYAGITHIALKVESLQEAEDYVKSKGIAITEHFAYGDVKAFFIRDPDGNVLEFDEYPESFPSTRKG